MTEDKPLQEGDPCPAEGCKGRLDFDCEPNFCPCPDCTDAPLYCLQCGWREERP